MASIYKDQPFQRHHEVFRHSEAREAFIITIRHHFQKPESLLVKRILSKTVFASSPDAVVFFFFFCALHRYTSLSHVSPGDLILQLHRFRLRLPDHFPSFLLRTADPRLHLIHHFPSFLSRAALERCFPTTVATRIINSVSISILEPLPKPSRLQIAAPTPPNLPTENSIKGKRGKKGKGSFQRKSKKKKKKKEKTYFQYFKYRTPCVICAPVFTKWHPNSR